MLLVRLVLLFFCRAQLPHCCELCGRRFKNLPALNGHMRLHGGYYKKVKYELRAFVMLYSNVTDSFLLVLPMLCCVDLHV